MRIGYERKFVVFANGRVSLMKFTFSYIMPFFVLIFLSSCATVQVSKNVQSGRRALKLNEPKEALTHFEAAARVNPNYTTRFTLLNTGIWTYVGRAFYELGEKEKALASLKRAKESFSGDYFASIYLGLVMAQNGRRREGIAVLESGLKGLGNWLDNITWQGFDGQYWDPDGHLKKGILQTQELLREEIINIAKVDENVRWLGREFEEEIEDVRDDKRREREDDDRRFRH